ncbi:hypothetical protein M413DRAFT_239544 [Hebeloma cylindrosporum]|uniref:Uncharacterized protein n=1 Tax=Hebeloma cylindrosporum TaxID=76867 RepID=A0A0C2YD31_HEBCY|nr:hypothetical protein M413DRAFT_239544 [Hebeloma cylindrosporum h7]
MMTGSLSWSLVPHTHWCRPSGPHLKLLTMGSCKLSAAPYCNSKSHYISCAIFCRVASKGDPRYLRSSTVVIPQELNQVRSPPSEDRKDADEFESIAANDGLHPRIQKGREARTQMDTLPFPSPKTKNWEKLFGKEGKGPPFPTPPSTNTSSVISQRRQLEKQPSRGHRSEPYSYEAAVDVFREGSGADSRLLTNNHSGEHRSLVESTRSLRNKL